MEMDPVIWSQLSEELLERILSLLPLRSILSLRPTCRRFNSLLLSPSFLSLHRRLSSSSASASASALILSHPYLSHRLLPIYSSAKWRTATLSSPSSAILLSTAEGLLLFSLPPSSSLLVSNPLTSASRLLPSPLPHSSPAVMATIATVSGDGGYIILLPSPSPNYLFLYESSTLSWSHLPADTTKNGCDAIVFAGSILFATHYPSECFDLTDRRWIPFPAPPPSVGDMVFVRLVVGGGRRLYLVGGVGGNGIARGLSVWVLETGEGGGWWEEAGTLPVMMWRKFGSVCYHNYSHVRCVWHEGAVVVGCDTWPEVLMFRVGRATWHWLPRCPLLRDGWSCGFRWFSFVPDLAALV